MNAFAPNIALSRDAKRSRNHDFWISWHSVPEKNTLHVILRCLVYFSWQVTALVLSCIILPSSYPYHWPALVDDIQR